MSRPHPTPATTVSTLIDPCPLDASAAVSSGKLDLSPERTAFFLDVDGTLLGFRSRPDDVVADPDLLRLLRVLREAAAGAVALVSGRMISDLDRIVAPLVLPAAGVHGADIRFADGARSTTGAAAMAPVRGAVATFVAARAGLFLEDKGATLALHYRHAPDREGEVQEFVQSLRDYPGIAVQEGKFVAELKPESCDKGTAILALMDTAPFVGRRPVFIGDDLTDEHGFAAVNRLGGSSIKVGPAGARTAASFRVADPDAVRALLRHPCRS